MSSRLNKALSAGKVTLVNRGTVGVSLTLFKLTDKNERKATGKRVKSKYVRTLGAGRQVELTRFLTEKEIRWAITNGNLRGVLSRRPIEVVDTWSNPASG